MFINLGGGERLNGILSAEAGDSGAGVFDFVAVDGVDEPCGFFEWNCHERRVVAQGYAAYRSGVKVAFGYDEAYDVASRDFLFFAYVEI